MNPVNENDVAWEERRSPKGKYHRYQRDLVGAMQSLPGGVPFDAALVRLPAGATNYPFHSHAAEWECYLILSGSGTIRHGDQRAPLAPGDCLMCPPGDPHQIVNDGDGDLLYYVIANNAPVEIGHYPDSDKWVIRGGTGTFRRTAVPHYEDEE